MGHQLVKTLCILNIIFGYNIIIILATGEPPLKPISLQASFNHTHDGTFLQIFVPKSATEDHNEVEIPLTLVIGGDGFPSLRAEVKNYQLKSDHIATKSVESELGHEPGTSKGDLHASKRKKTHKKKHRKHKKLHQEIEDEDLEKKNFESERSAETFNEDDDFLDEVSADEAKHNQTSKSRVQHIQVESSESGESESDEIAKASSQKLDDHQPSKKNKIVINIFTCKNITQDVGNFVTKLAKKKRQARRSRLESDE